jgi:hypothetical protein
VGGEQDADGHEEQGGEREGLDHFDIGRQRNAALGWGGI